MTNENRRVNWKELIENCRKERGDGPIIACTLDELGLLTRFNNGYGGSEGAPFTAWSEKRVYFPVVYDGAEWVSSAPRNPCEEAMLHVGGE